MAERSDSDPTRQDKGKPKVGEPTINAIDAIHSYDDQAQEFKKMAERNASGLTINRDIDSVDSYSVDQTDLEFKKMAERSCSPLIRECKGKAKVGEVPKSYFYYQTLELEKIAERSASGLTRQDKGKAKVGEVPSSYFYYQTLEFDKIEERSASGLTRQDTIDMDSINSYSVDQTPEPMKITERSCSGLTRQDKGKACSVGTIRYMDMIGSNFDDKTPKTKKLMADSIASDLTRQDKLGKGKVGEPRISDVNWMDALLDSQVIAVIQENVSHDPRMSSSVKKLSVDEAIEQVGDNIIIQKELEARRKTIAPPDTETNASSGPGSRYYKTADICLSKSLTPLDVIKQDARLHLDVDEATILSDDPDVAYYRPGTFSDYITVFDGADRQYHMILSNYASGGRLQYVIGGEWPRFVRANNLKAEDEIFFYQVDPRNGNNKHYAIKHIRKPPDPPARALKIGNKPIDDKQKDSKGGHYKLETMRKETGSLVFKFTKK